MNNFANDRLPIDADLLSTMKTSTALKDAIQALSLLHRKQQRHFIAAETETACGSTEALQAYSRSVRSMQKQIASNQFPGDPPALWTTFLLGIFEVCIIVGDPSKFLVCLPRLVDA
jgi:hypothetical protein